MHIIRLAANLRFGTWIRTPVSVQLHLALYEQEWTSSTPTQKGLERPRVKDVRLCGRQDIEEEHVQHIISFLSSSHKCDIHRTLERLQKLGKRFADSEVFAGKVQAGLFHLQRCMAGAQLDCVARDQQQQH